MTKKRDFQRLVGADGLGAVSLEGRERVKLAAGGEALMLKRALLVYEGTFKGMFGPVTLSAEFLQVLVDRYNRDHAKPQNEFDYAPVLIDHERKVDQIKGRLLPPLTLEDWENPRTGAKCKAVFGNLRLDDVSAQASAEAGKYVHVSLSFDDEQDNLGDLYEVSFVAVEAARGALAFEQGENRMKTLEQRLADAEQNGQSLSAKVTKLVDGNKAVALAIGQKVEAAKTDIATLSAGLVSAQKQFQVAATKSQFAAYIRQGKMTKAEFDKLNFEELASMPATALSALKSSYEGREPSTDIGQFGREGAEAPAGKALSKKQIRENIEAQRSGKKGAGQSLAADEQKPGEKPADGGKKDAPAAEPMSAEDTQKIMKALSDAHDCIKQMSEKLAAIEDEKKKLEDDKASA